MNPKESDESPSSDDHSGVLVIDEGESSEQDISPMKTRSGRINQREKAATVKTSQKDAPPSNKEPARTRSSKIHIDLTPEKSQATTQESLEDSQRLSQLSRYEMMERAAEFSQPSPYFKSPKKTSNKSSNSKLASDLDPDQPTPIPQRKTRFAKESTEISPEIPLPELPQSQESTAGWETQETQFSQLSRYEMMERAAEFSQSTTDATPDKNRTEHSPKTPRAGKKQNKAVESSPKATHSPRKTQSGKAISDDPLERIEKLAQAALASSQSSEDTHASEEGIAGISLSVSGELLINEVPSDPQISVSVSGELFNNEPQPMDTTQIPQQEEEEANSSQGSSVYETPEKSLPKTPRRRTDGVPRHNHVILGRYERKIKKVETKDNWSQVSGETLRETEGRKRRTHDVLNLCAEESQEEKSQEEINQTQRVGDLLNHTALALDSQQSTQASQARQESTSATQIQPQQESQGTNEKYFTPPTSPTLEQTSASQKTFDEDLDDDYFAKLKSPTSKAETQKINKQADQAKKQKRVNRKMPRSRAKPTRDEVNESLARACRKAQVGGISRRLEFARAFISRRYRARDSSDQQPLNRELEKAISWEPKVPNVNFSKPVPGSSTRFKKPFPVAEKPAKEKPGPSKSKASKSKSQQRSQPREEQESAHNWSQQALFDESAEDRQALSPEHGQSPSAPIDREAVREFMFPTSNKRKLQTPEKDAQGKASAKHQAAKRRKHVKENKTPKKSASKPTILKPAVDITIARRPGRDALSEISDLSSAFDNDTPIRGVGKMNQSQKKASKEKSAKPSGKRHDEAENQPTCSKNLTPPAMPPDVDLSSFLNSSEDEEVRRPQSRPRRRNGSPTASMPKLTKLRSPEKSPSPSKSKKKSIQMKKKHPKIIPSAARKPPRSITSSVETRDPREVYDEKTIVIKDVKNSKGRIGFRLSENSLAGIHISEVVPGSLADKAGLRAGDTLICFNGVRCSVKSKIKLSILLPVIIESASKDFEFTVLRDVPDQYSEEEDVDTSEVSDISDAESDVQVQNIDSDGNVSRVETPVDTNPEYGTFDNTANVTNLTSERNAAETTNPEYETFDRSFNITAGTSEQPGTALSGSSSDVSYTRLARKYDEGSSIADSVKTKKRKVGMSHYLNPRPESIASNQREKSDESASEVSVQTSSRAATSRPASRAESVRPASRAASSRISRAPSTSTLGPQKRKKWTDDEDALLIVGLNQYGKDWIKIWNKFFRETKRTNINLKDRHRQLLKQGDPRVKEKY
ncbi:Oidioi.mRNA.OKI2018_I69.PAR.g10616.t1.cds [Oikopleura dioica]|uniref:Oidioi.mRNA.OKI2018_I69.PAR.g10616.t1.cds n=1 Tax=Oikopleura dioica TaxID=34765 RepID=A0ABN7RUY4_OIKDI|nr:Oidioi.mRNA.OKI2018_I69.PAR.g10616.t1.cds [Oikopleura dioica]